jgi:hypothetical protein
MMVGMVVVPAGMVGSLLLWKTMVLAKIIYHERRALRSLSEADLSRLPRQQSR